MTVVQQEFLLVIPDLYTVGVTADLFVRLSAADSMSPMPPTPTLGLPGFVILIVCRALQCW